MDAYGHVSKKARSEAFFNRNGGLLNPQESTMFGDGNRFKLGVHIPLAARISSKNGGDEVAASFFSGAGGRAVQGLMFGYVENLMTVARGREIRVEECKYECKIYSNTILSGYSSTQRIQNLSQDQLHWSMDINLLVKRTTCIS